MKSRIKLMIIVAVLLAVTLILSFLGSYFQLPESAALNKCVEYLLVALTTMTLYYFGKEEKK